MQAFFFDDFKRSYLPHILYEIYIEKVYTRFISDLDKDNSTVLDIGANCGIFSHYIKDYCKRVVAVEASATHVASIHQMIDYNKITNIEVVQKALSNSNGTATFNHSNNATMFSLESAVSDVQDKEIVETITIDKLMENLKIDQVDFMKLDVEGSEFRVLSSKEFEKIAPKIKNIVVEWHQWTGTNPNQLMGMLKDYGYKVEKIPAQAILFSARR